MRIQALTKTDAEKQRNREAEKGMNKSSSSVSLLLCFFGTVFVLCPPRASADDWKSNPIWHDGLVEKAVYSASRVVYNKPRPYTATFFTNKEQHDTKTLTKSDKSKDTVEVWKHNQVEDIPTPNYTYHYVTTTHLTIPDGFLTRFDCSSQEFCGTSFKQYLLKVWPGVTTGMLDYFAFSYMPEAGRTQATLNTAVAIPLDALPLYLRDYDFAAKPHLGLVLLPSQKSNRPTPHDPFAATARYAGEENNAHKLILTAANDKPLGTYWFAKDRLHLMTKYQGADGQTYDLKELSRVNYWTIKGE
jgi:hypothetical protein